MKITSNQYAKALLEVVDDKSEKEVNELVLNFFKIVKKNGQLKLMPKIIQAFSLAWNDKKGIVEVEISSAEELGTETQGKIETYLKKKHKVERIIIKQKVDKNLLGGISLKVKDEIFDYSVRGNLKKLSRELVK